jgi:Fic family protein
MTKILQDIRRKKSILKSYSPFSKELEDKIDIFNKIEIAYTNLIMDGVKVSREEIVTVLVEEGLRLIKPRAKRIQIQNYGILYNFLKKKKKDFRKYHNNIKLEDIQKIHTLLLQKVNNRNAGKYRDIDIRIKDARFKIPESESIPTLMNEFVEWMNKAAREEDPLKWAVDAHFKLIEIMPFVDANSRAARQLMNLILLENNYPPVITKSTDKAHYLEVIKESQQTKNMEPYYNMIYHLINDSLDLYLDFL